VWLRCLRWTQEQTLDRGEAGFCLIRGGFYPASNEKPSAKADDRVVARDVAGFVRIPESGVGIGEAGTGNGGRRHAIFLSQPTVGGPSPPELPCTGQHADETGHMPGKRRETRNREHLVGTWDI
jgi:hypothetical protein